MKISDSANVSCLLHLQHFVVHLARLARHMDLLHPQDCLQGYDQRNCKSHKRVNPQIKSHKPVAYYYLFLAKAI